MNSTFSVFFFSFQICGEKDDVKARNGCREYMHAALCIHLFNLRINNKELK